ncbi:MAG: hypothetical protein JWO15_1739 [Sphingomonadales bacterium]|nr:hypothetical protein [Sphingomonadales bacterium]
MLPKKGNHFPRPGKRISPEDFARAISIALREEVGFSHVAAKTVMRWTGASERTAKNWLAGTNCPCGWHLVLLARESDAVMASLLGLAGRDITVSALSLISLKAGLMSAVNAIDEAIDLST